MQRNEKTGITVLKGTVCYSEGPDILTVREGAYLVFEEGLVAGVFDTLPEQYAPCPVEDLGTDLIIPGMTDLHVHAPQFTFRGLGMDRELLDWLTTYTFPEEARYKDLAYAKAAYGDFAAHLKNSTTTRACVFATIHTPATVLLMEQLEAAGIGGCVGRVSMDRNCPAGVREPSAEAAIAAERAFIEETLGRFDHIRPILTPRFIPTCSDELMRGLHALQKEYRIPLQSHLSENPKEIAWVKELCPGAASYGDAYRRFGFFDGDSPVIMAHCVYSDAAEQQLLKEGGVFIAHSPESNTNIASGVAPASAYIDGGQRIGLATDIAGGSQVSILKAMEAALRASKLRWRLQDSAVPPLTFERAFFLATRGGGAFFGRVGTFLPGFEADAVVLSDDRLFCPRPLTPRERLERMVSLADDREIKAKFLKGKRVLG